MAVVVLLAAQARQSEEPPLSPDAVVIPRRDDWTRRAWPGRVSIAEPYGPGSNEAVIKRARRARETLRRPPVHLEIGVASAP